MKRILGCLCSLLMAVCVKAQTMLESTTYATDEIKEITMDISPKRMIGGGTKLLITYEGQWDNKMKSAFEYACKIWEECVPTTLPIKIKAVMGSIRGNKSNEILSKASYATYPWGRLSAKTATSTQIKAVLLMEGNIGCNISFREFVDSAFFEKYDIVLTYNYLLMNQMSFSLNPSATDKYDFITLVLRDLVKCFGFSWNQVPQISGDNKEMNVDDDKLTPFEKRIADAIIGETPKDTYDKATQGIVDITMPYYGDLHLYAPSPWKNGVSLNTFIPEESKGLTQLLTYDFGKGTIIRDIRDNYATLFEFGMDWWADIATGFHSSSCSDISYSTENVIPYQGKITENYPYRAPSNESYQPPKELKTASPSKFKNQEFDVSDYCLPFCNRLSQTGNYAEHGGWTVGLLKKDGTWDIVYESLSELDPLNFSTAYMEMHSDITEYARTCDGYLRARIAYFRPETNPFGGYSWHGFNIYYVLDYLPQKVEQKRIQKRDAISVRPIGTEKITVGIKNLEGVDRIMVEQWEEGEIVPYKFEVQNFKNGYFNATIDNRFDNELKVISYNKNGSTISEPLVIKGTSFEKWDKDITDDNIIIGPPIGWNDPDGKFLRKLGTVSYDITPISGFSSAKSISGECETVPLKINISSLPAGTYTLNLYMMKGKKHSIKFMKK